MNLHDDTAAPGSTTGARLSLFERRRALRLANWQGALWSAGNGLTTGAVLTYLLVDLGAGSEVISLSLALPALVGMLRLLTPTIVRRLGGDVKRFALAAFIVSYGLLLTLSAWPILAALGLGTTLSASGWPLAIWIGGLAVHQLLEYCGAAALWAWLGELAPTPIRGRYFALRQRWQLATLIPILIGAGSLGEVIRTQRAALGRWGDVATGVVFGLGAMLLLASLVPLAQMPAVSLLDRPTPSEPRQRQRLPALSPFPHSTALLRLLLVGCWFSFFNGLTQTAQNTYPRLGLSISLVAMLAMTSSMRIGQFALSGLAGRMADRYGNRIVIIVSQAVVACGMLFFFTSTPEEPWWIVGAWICWSAYVGLNISLPNLVLKLAPPGAATRYAAIYFAVTSLAYAGATLLGGLLFRYWQYDRFTVSGYSLDGYHFIFYVGWVTRLLGAFVALAIIEPGAWTLPELLGWDSRSIQIAREAAIHPLDR